MLHRQLSSKDRVRKSWEAHFGPAKVVKEKVGEGRAADFVAFDCTSQEKAAHGHVAYAVQEASKTASKGLKTAHFVPEMRCAQIVIENTHNSATG